MIISLIRMICLGLVLCMGNSLASEYSPPGIYDVEHYVLNNGLRVILKPRDGTRSVAFRLVVGIGQNDYDCDRAFAIYWNLAPQ